MSCFFTGFIMFGKNRFFFLVLTAYNISYTILNPFEMLVVTYILSAKMKYQF